MVSSAEGPAATASHTDRYAFASSHAHRRPERATATEQPDPDSHPHGGGHGYTLGKQGGSQTIALTSGALTVVLFIQDCTPLDLVRRFHPWATILLAALSSGTISASAV